MKAMIERQKRRGINPRAIRAMVGGIPNVGKSTLINRIANKKAVQAADRPGVTRSLTWVKVTKGLELLDTPGVLWLSLIHIQMCIRDRNYSKGVKVQVSRANTHTVWIVADQILFTKEYDTRITKENFTEKVAEKLGAGFSIDQISITLSDDGKSVTYVSYVKDGIACETLDGEDILCGNY